MFYSYFESKRSQVSPQGDNANHVAPTIKETLKVRFAETFRVSLLYNKTHVEMNYGKKV